MARVSGVDIPREKRVEVALTYVFGIGRTLSQETLAATGVDPNTRVRDLSEAAGRDREYVDNNIRTEGDLRREIQADIRRKVEIGCYQGLRHAGVCPSAVSAPAPTPAPARARVAPSPVRRSRARSSPQRTPVHGLRCRTDHLP